MPNKPFSLSLKVVIRDKNDRCLLLKRSMSSKGNPGKWDFPGGKADPGERFDHALLREVAEETGLTIVLDHVVGAAESELPEKKVAYLFFEGTLISGEIQLSEEHDNYIWVPIQDLTKIDLPIQFRRFADEYSKQNIK
jgi:8-oxo-dGTP diphosphatase